MIEKWLIVFMFSKLIYWYNFRVLYVVVDNFCVFIDFRVNDIVFFIKKGISSCYGIFIFFLVKVE